LELKNTLIRALMFRQDYRINKIFLPFSRPAGQAAERQKASIVDSSALFSAKAELRFLGFIPARLASLPACQELARQTGENVAGRWKP